MINASTIGDETVTQETIRDALRKLGGWGSVYVPEYTWNELRIDALVIDTRKRWVRGFEIKLSRSDFLRDEKWQLYTQFCSSLSIVCPKGLIAKSEVSDPFGLLYVSRTKYGQEFKWEKKPRRFQRRESLSWVWTYIKVIERELPRLVMEIEQLRSMNHKLMVGAA